MYLIYFLITLLQIQTPVPVPNCVLGATLSNSLTKFFKKIMLQSVLSVSKYKSDILNTMAILPPSITIVSLKRKVT